MSRHRSGCVFTALDDVEELPVIPLRPDELRVPASRPRPSGKNNNSRDNGLY
jgi:hypothetical protein